jgi:hypothetical protein
MDFIKPLTAIPDDPRWKEKLAIGTAVVLISSFLIVFLVGILGYLILVGYCVRLMKNVDQGARYALPEWDDWSGDLNRGFKLAVVYLVWALPLLFLSVPMVFGGILSDTDSAFASGIGALFLMVGYCLTMVYGLALLVLSPGFTIHFVRGGDQIGAGLRLSAVWEWTKRHVSEVILYAVAYFVASMLISIAASVVGVLLLCVGLIVTIPLGTLLQTVYQFNLLGQIMYKDRTRQEYYPTLAAQYAPVAPAPVVPVAPPPVAPAAPVTNEPTVPTPPPAQPAAEPPADEPAI